MFRSALRVLALAGALLGITALGTGTAMAVEVPAYAPGHVGRALFYTPDHVLLVYDSYCADNRAVGGFWTWQNGDGVLRSLVDPGCANNTPAGRVLNPPFGATGIYFNACTVDGAGNPLQCGPVSFSGL